MMNDEGKPSAQSMEEISKLNIHPHISHHEKKNEGYRSHK